MPHTKYRIRGISLLIAVLSLIAILAVVAFYIPKKKHLSFHYYNIEQRVKREINALDHDIEQIKDRLNENPAITFSNLSRNYNYYHYIIKDGRILFWSDDRFDIPPKAQTTSINGLRFFYFDQGYFLLKRTRLEAQSNRYDLYSLLPLFINSSIENDFIQSYHNEKIFSSNDFRLSYGTSSLGEPVYLGDKYLFTVSLSQGYQYQNRFANYWIFTWSLILITSLLIYSSLWVNKFSSTKAYLKAFLLLFITLALIRYLMIYFQIPFSVIEMDLFNPKYFASSEFNPSLGDLLLNTICLAILSFFIFRFYFRGALYRSLMLSSENLQKIFVVGASFITFYILRQLGYVIQLIYFNSQLSLDITQGQIFETLPLAAHLVLALYAIIYFLLAHLLFKIIIKLDFKTTPLVLYFSLGAILYLLLFYNSAVSAVMVIAFNTMYFLLVNFFKLHKYLVSVRYTTFLYFFICAFICAAFGAFEILQFEQKIEIQNKRRFAQEVLLEDDNLAEFLLSEASQKIKSDRFIINRLISPFSSKDVIEKKIRRVYLNRYFDKYDVAIHLFNFRGDPIGADQKIDNYFRWYEKYYKPKYETNYENLVFVDEADAYFLQRYINFIPLKRGNMQAGFIIIDLKLKRYTPSTVYPELLVDRRFLTPYLNKNYSYAVFNKRYIAYSAGPFNYQSEFNAGLLDKTKLYGNGIRQAGYHHLGLAGEDKKIVISSPIFPVNTIISNFSFLYLILIFIILIMVFFYAFNLSRRQAKLNYATRIQLYLNTAFFLPLFIVSTATLSLIGSSYKKNVTRDYYNKTRNVGLYLLEDLKRHSDSPDQEDLSTMLSEISQYVQSDINFFNRGGRLVASSQEEIYERDVLSTLINPNALIQIVERGNDHTILDERVGELKYRSAYYGIRSFESGVLIGIVSIPFFESKMELDEQVNEVLTTIINIFTSIFILSLILSFFASKILTYPLKLITQKIRKVSLSRENEPLEWRSDDEIGLLVSEYNQMLVKLEESKAALSRSEKESAWREMARQVAHEIKNPLTPMKLSLQHLRRMLKEQKNNGEIVEKPIDSLLHQIDTLSDIATSFSSFAKMPTPKNERFEITKVLRRTTELFKNEYGKIKYDLPSGKYFVRGDRKLMGRIFSNLIINGLQSAEDKDNANVFIKMKVTESNKAVLIEFRDTGSGIPNTIQEKVFLPNFSTKTSGSGLGLAIAKRGIEHAGGNIWFETEESMGTTFFIKLPLIS